MDPIKIIQKFYKADSKSYAILIRHSQTVTQKALNIARNLSNQNPDLNFIAEAAMLHDIGIFLTNTPELGCFGTYPYISHGYLGRELLEKEGLSRHALVCERHVGVGISIDDIKKQNLPLPHRDMLSVSIEEQIICFADKFFSKDEQFIETEKPISLIRKNLSQFGHDKVTRFNSWLKTFGY